LLILKIRIAYHTLCIIQVLEVHPAAIFNEGDEKQAHSSEDWIGIASYVAFEELTAGFMDVNERYQ
jgi:hypothetical protein